MDKDNAGEITRLRRENAELRTQLRQVENEKHVYAELVNNLPNPVFFKDREGLYQWCNEAFERLVGYKKEEIINKTVYDIWPEKLAGESNAVDCSLLENPGAQFYETDITTAEDEYRNVKIYKATYTDLDGNIAGVVGVLVDITASREMEQALQESEEKYRQIVKYAPAAIYKIDFVNQRFARVNDVMCEITGYTREELLTMNVYDLLAGESKKHFSDRLKAHFSGQGVPEATEFKIITRDGQEKWSLIHASFITENGIPVGAEVVAHDITERKMMEEQIRESKEKYTELFENAHDVIYEHDFAGNFTSVNATAVRVYGYTKEEFLQMNIKQVVSPEYIQEAFNNIEFKLKSNKPAKPYQLLTCTKNGSPVWLEINTRLIEDKGRPVGIQGIARDITERKQVEKALKQSESLYRTIFENAGTAIIIGEQDTLISLVNSEFVELSGYAREEIEGEKSWTEFIYNEEDLDELKSHHYRRCVEPVKVPKSYEIKFVNRQGNLKDVLLTVAVIPGAKRHVASFLDITELKQYQAEINRLDRLNIIGQMAAGIGHELRNPMTTVRGLLQLLQAKTYCQSYHEQFELMIEELDRANNIISQFLAMGREKTAHKTKNHLNTLIKKMEPLIQSDAMQARSNVCFELGEIPYLYLDEHELRQIILNFTRNGLEAMPGGGTLTVSTFMDGGEVVLMVQDEGEGIDSEVLEKLGTPFFTTKGYGTGLGLAVCYNSAEKHNAYIDVKSDSGGTRFMLRFRPEACVKE